MSRDGADSLEVDEIQLRFGGVTAINDVSFDVGEGELFAIIGPNGAGKTSIFNSISQVYHPQTATSAGRAQSIMGMRPDKVAELGIARTFQNIELFPQMTVIDNLLTGRHVRMKRSWLAGARVVRARPAGRSWRTAARSRTSSTSSRSSSGASTPSRCCRTGSRSASSSAGRWPWSPSCCCSTSRWPA